MNTDELVKYTEDPRKLTEHSLAELRSIIKKYPYFQLAYSLLIINLKNIGDPRFEEMLREYAIFVKDRNQLFRLLNRLDNLKRDEKKEEEEAEKIIETPASESEKEPETITEEDVEPADKQQTEEDQSKRKRFSKQNLGNRISETLSNQISEADSEKEKEELKSEFFILDKSVRVRKENNKPDEKENIETPENVSSESENTVDDSEKFELDDKDDVDKDTSDDKPKLKYSSDNYFGEDLLKQDIERTEESDDLIAQFIKKNPELEIKKSVENEQQDISEDSAKENEEFLTEKLARLYEKQGYYQKAIDTFEKLSLKYPEKSDYFADQIKKIKQIINEQ